MLPDQLLRCLVSGSRERGPQGDHGPRADRGSGRRPRRRRCEHGAVPAAGPLRPLTAGSTLRAMKGVVAGGNHVTAEAGAQVLREGGNAFDAAVCAVLTSFASESTLTGLGAG